MINYKAEFKTFQAQTEEDTEISSRSSISGEKNESETPIKPTDRYTPIFEPKVAQIYQDESSGSEDVSNPNFKGL